MKSKIILFAFLMFLFSCKTYTVLPESLKTQLMNVDQENKSEVKINNPLLIGTNLTYLANNIKTLNVIDKDGNELNVLNTPALEMRVTTKDGKKFHFYFDTITIENDILKGGRSRFMPNLKTSIPYNDIVKIEVQDGGKNYHYK